MIDFLYRLLTIESYDLPGKMECAQLLKEELMEYGFEVNLLNEGEVPFVYAKLTGSSSGKQILFYSHYDVKPAGDFSKWNTRPFEPYVSRDTGRIYARGSGDAKGQIYCILEGIRRYLGEVDLNEVNISVLFEGDEESGSPYLESVCEKYLSDTFFDCVILCDSHWYEENPLVGLGTRGQVSLKLQYDDRAMKQDCHAGNFGGILEGAAEYMSRNLNVLLPMVRKMLSSNDEPEETFHNAISLVYIDGGNPVRSLIPKSCISRLDIRYLKNFDIDAALLYITEFCNKKDIDVTVEQREEGAYSESDRVYGEMISDILRKATKKEPMTKKYIGAYLPLKKLMKIRGNKYIVPLAQSDEHNHAPNENIALSHIKYGCSFIRNLLEQLNSNVYLANIKKEGEE